MLLKREVLGFARRGGICLGLILRARGPGEWGNWTGLEDFWIRTGLVLLLVLFFWSFGLFAALILDRSRGLQRLLLFKI